MYKYKDYNYSLEEVQDAADKEKLSIDEYIKEFNIQKTDPDSDEEGKETPSQETVDATVEVDGTASKSETSSLELANPKLTNFEAYEDFVSTPSKVTPEGQIELRQRKREDVSEEIFDPVELEEVVVTGEKIETDAADALVKLEIEDYRSPAEKLVKRLAEGVEPQDPATMSTARSIYNTTINALNQLSSVDEKAEFLGAFISSDIDLIYNIFGEKAGKKILKENQKRLSKASKRFDEINSYSLPTIGFTDIPERKGFTGKLGGGVAGALNALSAFGTSIAISAPTFGVGLASDMIAGSVKTFNDNKAARLGISFDELIKQGKGDLFVPAALGVFGYGLERAGIKGVSNSINAMSNPAKKGLYSLLNAGGKEGTTEYLQGGVEVFNEALGQGKNIDEAGNVVFNYLTSKEGFENLLQGAFGGVGMSAGGRFVKAASAIKTPAENQEIANLVTEYSSLEDQKYKRSLTQEERDILIKSQDNIKIQLTSQIKKNNVLVASMNENQIDNINNNLDLIRSIQKQERAINESGNLSEEAKASALNQLQKDKKLAQDQIFNERNQAERRAANINKIKQLAETEQNLEIQDFATTAEVEQYLKENNIAKGQTKKAANQQGFFVQRPGQKDLIVINRQQSNKDNAVNVAAHEYLHYILSKMIAKDSEAANKLGKSLDQYLNKIDSEQIESSQFKQRLEQYKNLPEAERNEEVLALFSDALAQGDLKFDTNIFTNIGDATRRFFQDLGVGIKFNKGKDVFNFIRDYNKSVEEARLTEAQRKLIEADDSSAVKQAEEVIKESRSEEASNKVQEIYEEKGINGALEIIEQFKPITNKIVEQRKNAPGFDRQLLTDEIETGAGGILDLIQAYDPASNVPLAAYINKFLPVRAITASRRILEEEFAGDIAEAPQVAAEAAPEVEAEVTPAKAKKQVKKETLSAENQQALEDVVADLELTEDELTFKTLPNAAIEVFAKQIGIPAKKFAGASNFTQGELGAVINFIEENIDIIRQALPQAAVLEGAPVSEGLIGTATGVPNNLLKDPNLYTRKERTTKKAGLVPYEKNKGIDNSSILKAIGIIEGKRTAGPRDKQAQTAKGLINVLAKFATNQEVRQRKDLTPQQKTDIETGKGSRLLYSLNTKGDGTWKPSPINPLSNNKVYNFNVGDNSFVVTLFENNDFDYEILEQTEGIKDDSFVNDPKSMATSFFNVEEDSYEITGKVGQKDSIKVFSIVANSLLDIIKKDNLNSITFVAKEPNRQRLYLSMIQKFQKELGWESYSFPVEGETAFTVYNPEVFKSKETAPSDSKESRILFSRSLSKVFGLSASDAFSFNNISDINSGRIELKDLSSSMIKDVGIQEWINIIDPVISRQYKVGDKQLLDNKIGFDSLELTEKEFNENKNILLERAVVDGKRRSNQFLTRGRKDYYENILSNAINKNVKWVPRKGVEIDGIIYKTPIVPTQSPKGFINKKEWDISLPERIKFAENQKQGFKKIIQKLTNTYQNSNKSRKDKVKIGMVLNTFNSNINGLIRTAAIPGLEFRVKELNKASDYRYEHTQPASETLRQLAKIIVGNKNAQTFEEIMENFRVAIIPKIYDDVINKVRIAGKSLRSTSPLDENKNLQKPIESTKPTRYEAASKAIANAGLAPLILTDAIVPADKAQVKLSKSKSKAAIKNNLELPKSQRLPKGSTNEQVLGKMQELDNEANEARIKYSKSQNLDEAFNDIIEAKTGIETYKRFSPAKAAVRGASKGKFNFFIPPSAEDFTGLLYKTLAKGKLGDRQMQWYKDNLLDPYARAMNDISAARVAMFEDYKQLKKDLKVIPKDLKKKSVDEYTREQAVRVYIWNEQGNKIPGLFKTDQKQLVDYVNNDPELKLFADQLVDIQKNDDYSAPKDGWLTGSITTDLLENVNSIKRKKYLEQWQNNVDEVFSEVNMNKLEAAFGKPYRKALENILTRMKTGRNKPFRSDTLAGRVTDWLNNSVGAIMFFNTRSAVLQTISSINFVNWSDNNIYEAGKAFANQPQYWKDFKFLFNSDFLKERRGGLRFNVSESEIADMAKKGGARGVISKILQAGFLPTQAADSFAIASGGATFYRNRIKSYIKEGLTEAEAQEKAFLDFREIAEESQQSSRPDRISAQQAGPLGRTILAFANTPAQYARLTKKAASDLINGRGDAKTNISKLLYYGAVQNLIFNTLQQAAFAIAFGDDDEDEKKKEEKYISVANGMADGLLRGIGVGGAVIATLKNALVKIIKESEKKRPDYAETAVIQLLGISPPIQSKAQKIRSALKSYEWNKDEMKEKGFSLDNPAYLAGANVISASTNVPLDRVIKKVNNVRAATRDDISKLERMMLLAGWSDWQLGIQPKRKPKKKKKTRSSGRGTSRSNSRSSNRR